MDAMGLLGSLMGNNAVASGGGGNLLGSLLGGAMGGGGGAGGMLGSVLSSAMGGSQGRSSSGFGQKALMGVLGGLAVAAATKYVRNRMNSGGGQAPAPAQGGFMDVDPDEAMASTGYDDNEANSRAEVLIRAMINAAKSDGHVDDQEQQNIIQRVGDVGQEEADFLRRELSAPLDVDGFIRSIPRGMEQEVYAMSLMGIQLDENAEAQYLFQLAQGMGLPADVCNNIHRELGAPEIFQ